MSKLNENIPSFKALVKKSWFTKNEKDNEEYYNCYVFGLQSYSGKILTFHIMTDDGMLRSRVPISEIYTKIPKSDVPYHYKQLWDCFSENVSVTKFEFLKKGTIILKNKKRILANYLFTVDWYNNAFSETPSDYKCGHVLESEDGYLVCQPNNRILWQDPNWITKEEPKDLKLFKVDNELLSVEMHGTKWEDSDSFFYEIKKEI